MNIVRQVEQLITQEEMLNKGERILVAVSGGPDSTALLHVLHVLAEQWGIKLYAAHLDHGFRGAESRQEAQFVRQMTADLGVDCEIAFRDLPAILQEQGGNSQEVARRLRYEFLLSAAKKFGAQAIALGHHADDQAETVLMRIIRGTGLSGLGGMSPQRMEQGVRLIRPLLQCTKEEIQHYLREQGIGYCMDSSNEARKYSRNKLRLDVMPQLRGFNPELSQAINRLAELARDEDRFMAGLTETEYKRIVSKTEVGFVFSRHDLLQLNTALQRRLIKLILRYLSPYNVEGNSNSIHIEQVRHAVQQNQRPSVRLDLPGAVLIREYDHIDLRRADAWTELQDYTYVADLSASWLQVPEAGAALSFEVIAAHALPSVSGNTRWSMDFDYEQLSFPLIVRNRKNGDRMQLMNMSGSVKLRDLFVNIKLAPHARKRVPLIVDAGQRIVWIPGIRRSRHALVSETTNKILRITLHQHEDSHIITD